MAKPIAASRTGSCSTRFDTLNVGVGVSSGRTVGSYVGSAVGSLSEGVGVSIAIVGGRSGVEKPGSGVGVSSTAVEIASAVISGVAVAVLTSTVGSAVAVGGIGVLVGRTGGG